MAGRMAEVKNHRENGAQNFASRSKNRLGTLTAVGLEMTYGTAGNSAIGWLGRICVRKALASSKSPRMVTVRGDDRRSRVLSAYSWI